MSGEQGALNHLEQGDFSTALNDVETSLKNFFTKDFDPAAIAALKLFISTFATPFGQQALALAGTAVADAVSGQSVTQIAASITPQITADAVTDAEKAGTTVLNAARVQLTAATAATPAT